jgi:anti-sigma regulatory factor (Ser/Thr protein kinase)
VEKARRLVEEIGAFTPLTDTRIYDMKVSLSEACANGIEHGGSGVDITAWVLPDRILFDVTNEGRFHPGLNDQRAGRHRGLGLPIMMALADQVHLARMEGGLTRVSLTFLRP